jgi:hypothetical protein
MEDPISPARRTLLKAGAATLATPVAAAIAQPAAAPGHQEAKTFDLWVISDQHVGTDKAASEGIQHGLVGFRPPPVRAESLATALRQSEEGGAFGGPPFNWDIALNLGDYAGFWDAPEGEQGREVVRQYSVLKRHRREQVYNIAGNHDASPHGHPANEGKETNWWFRKWCDPVGEHTETLAARARALLPARRHACGGRLVPASRARARVFEAVLLELSARRPEARMARSGMRALRPAPGEELHCS